MTIENKKKLKQNGFLFDENEEITISLTDFCDFFKINKNEFLKDNLFSNCEHKTIQINLLKLSLLKEEIFINKNNTLKEFEKLLIDKEIMMKDLFSINILIL